MRRAKPRFQSLACVCVTYRMPSKDEEIFVEMMMEQLGLASSQDCLADFL